jgi:hypothetical protein
VVVELEVVFNMKNYLPSKKFKRLLILFVILAIIFFIAFNLFSDKNNFSTSKKSSKLELEKLTVGELVKKDSDGDGVLDWEEALWGTDPQNKATFENVADATYIKNKRAEIKTETNTDATTDNTKLTETDKFAREFFASYSAMKTSGQMDDSTITNFSTSLGQKIVDPFVFDKYSEKDIKLAKNDEYSNQEDYYIAAGNLFEEYKAAGLGDELEIAGGMVSSGKATDLQNENKLIEIATAYQKFSKELVLIPTPKTLSQYQLRILNASNNTGIAVMNMSKMLKDPIVGISGIAEYEKYSNDLINSVHDLEVFLSISDIITE